MAGLRNLLNGAKDDEKSAKKVVKPLEKEFPLVAEILGGSPATEKEAAISPGTITIFIHGGKARFSANVKSAEITLIGDVADIVNLWGSINSAILVGDVSSKRYTERNAILTAEQNGVKLY